MLYLFLLLSCAEKSTSVDASQFDNRCTLDEDCMSVVDGNICGCNCNFVGINVSEADAWNESYNDVKANCKQEEIPDCFACPPIENVCENQVCTVQQTEDEQ